MMRRRTLLAAAGAGALASVLATGTARADSTIAVDPSIDYGTWEGWGTSLAWWANVWGGRVDYADVFADLFFTDKWTTLNGKSLPGLNLNIARYNLGACSWNSVNGATMVASPNIPGYKQIEGYWQEWGNEDPASSNWKWSADAAQRAMLIKATQRGAKSELFANSPMWWMCVNHNPSGAPNRLQNNLQAWNYRQHASHMAAVALYAKQNWGVNFASVEPFNEPSASYWYANGIQEGCYMSRDVQAAVLPYVRSELDSRGLKSTLIAASDETSIDDARATWSAFNSSTRAVVDRVNVHGYQVGGGPRLSLYDEVVTTSGKRLWSSETGNGDAGGFSMAASLLADLNSLHPTAWAYWQPLDTNPSWAMIQYTPPSGTTAATVGAVQTKYYLMAHFSRHIRPGMKIIHTGDSNAAAAFDEAANKLVIVAANPSTTTLTNLTFDLSGFSTVTGRSGAVSRWNTGAGDNYTARSATLNGKSLTIPVNARCVQTVEVEGVFK
ncbi:glycoside hydrolase [Streptomyces sp. NPDC051001]|uniref:glycoside hydrolase n=1 Tax=Streptomyces sp. NPDC051001 TaxID=3155795 RepID=UPI003423FCD6